MLVVNGFYVETAKEIQANIVLALEWKAFKTELLQN